MCTSVARLGALNRPPRDGALLEVDVVQPCWRCVAPTMALLFTVTLLHETFVPAQWPAASPRLLHSEQPQRPCEVSMSLSPLHRRQMVTAASLWTASRFSLRASANQIGKPLADPKVPDPERNVFARILRGDAPAEVLEDGDELFSFKDIRPASDLHYLIIPKRFIRDAEQLGRADADLVRRMEAKATELVRATVGEAFDPSELAIGYHWPPWYSVPWLHLHAIYPRRNMIKRWKYTPLTFKSPEWVLRHIGAET